MADTKRLSTHIQGKVLQLDYDFITTMDDDVCCYCLTDKQVQIILGMLDYVGWSTRWYSDSGTIDTEIILELQGNLGEALMSGCCGGDFPVLYRYTDDGILQKSTDGGLTYVDAPEDDPRNNSPEFPPVGGSDGDDKKCVAATGMVMLIKEQVGEQLTDDMSRYTLTNLINDWVNTMLNTSNPFEALMRVVANQIFSLVIATLRPALTEEVYDKLLCDFYNNMGDDATFTNAQVDNVRSDITTDIGGIAGVFFEHLVYLLGAVGLTNLARQQAATSGDCSDCEECEGCDTSGWIVSPPADGGNGVIDHEASNCNTLVVTAFVGGGDGRYYAQVWSGGGSDDGCVITALEYTGSAVDFLIAWDLVGEVQGTYAHSGASPVAIVGANVCSVMTRNISPNTTTIHT